MPLLAPGDVAATECRLDLDGFAIGGDSGFDLRDFSLGPLGHRTQDQPNPTGAGRFFGRDAAEARTLTFEVLIARQTDVEAWNAAAALQAAWSSDRVGRTPGAVQQLTIVRPGGSPRVVFGRARSPEPVYFDAAVGYVPFVLTFACQDHLFYDATEQALTLYASGSSPGGGLMFPATPPFDFVAGPATSDVARVGGDAETWPRFTFHAPNNGSATRPRVDFVHLGRSVWLQSTLRPGDAPVVVETRPGHRGAFQAGANVSGWLRGDWLERLALPVGDTVCDFSVDDPSGTSRASIAWRDAYSAP